MKILLFLTLITQTISLFYGLMVGAGNHCAYRSIGSRMNISYVVGCELAKPRFNLTENK
jgi:hypothetical protein